MDHVVDVRAPENDGRSAWVGGGGSGLRGATVTEEESEPEERLRNWGKHP